MDKLTASGTVHGAETAFETMPGPGKIAAKGTDTITVGTSQPNCETSAPIDDGYNQGGGVLNRINVITNVRHDPQMKVFAATLANRGVV